MPHKFTVEGHSKNILAVLVDITTSVHDQDITRLEKEQDQFVVKVRTVFTMLIAVVSEKSFSV